MFVLLTSYCLHRYAVLWNIDSTCSYMQLVINAQKREEIEW